MDDDKQIILNNLRKEIKECMEAGQAAEEEGRLKVARMEYENAKEALDMIKSIGGECDMADLVEKKLKGIPEVSMKDLMHDVDTNPLGRLVVGPYFYKSACCERMRETIRREEMGLSFDCLDGGITIDMHPKYFGDVVKHALKTESMEDVMLFYPEAFNDDGELDLERDFEEEMDYVQTECCPFCGAIPEKEFDE